MILSLVQAVLGFVGVILLLMILWGGFTVMIFLGNDEKRSQGYRTIISAVVGVVIIFLSYAIASFVINALSQATGAG